MEDRDLLILVLVLDFLCCRGKFGQAEAIYELMDRHHAFSEQPLGLALFVKKDRGVFQVQRLEEEVLFTGSFPDKHNRCTEDHEILIDFPRGLSKPGFGVVKLVTQSVPGIFQPQHGLF